MKKAAFFGPELLRTIILFTIDSITKALFIKSQGAIIFSVFNKAGAWGIPFPMGMLIIISVIAIILCFLVYARRLIPKRTFILLLAGALGNLFDRIVFGGVRDWINIQIIPVFNLADIFITLGVCVFIYHERYTKRGKH